MAISQKCKPIASSGLMAYLAIDDALEGIHEEDYKEAYSACGNAIGHFNTMFINKHITPEELVKVTAPLIAAKGAYDLNNKDRMFEEILDAMETTKEFIFQKVVACECEGR
ncbi:unnamed protein product [marine sediment metagenome]|uniref:Uncharacterized protein n=1 Tax=marine sediment metagenome TaxID=412755 RepID=X1RUW8_9ZZZZ